MKTFTINGKEYKSKMIDFNLVCDLEDMGVSITDGDMKNMSLIRGYFGLCAGLSREKAGREMQEHFKNGGKLEEFSDVLKYEFENSEFFQSLRKGAEEENTENPTEESEKEEKNTEL